jgi:hypothetical protein
VKFPGENWDRSIPGKKYLTTLITKIRGSTAYHYRKNHHFVRQAEKLLKALKPLTH